jgi:hypothetical protein
MKICQKIYIYINPCINFFSLYHLSLKAKGKDSSAQVAYLLPSDLSHAFYDYEDDPRCFSMHISRFIPMILFD